MTTEEIHEGNILIATFMGHSTENYYRYDAYWDQLMPVVDKIDKLTLLNETYFRTTIGGSRNRTHCYIYKYTPGASVGKEVSEGHENSKINAVYKAVVEFIKWYNGNNL